MALPNGQWRVQVTAFLRRTLILFSEKIKGVNVGGTDDLGCRAS